MFVVAHCHPEALAHRSRRIRLAVSAISLAVVGCSADITRFDSPYFALNEGGGSKIAAGSSGNAGGGPISDVARVEPAYEPTPIPYSAPSRSSRDVEVAALPVVDRPVVPVAVPPPAATPARQYRPAAVAPRAPSRPARGQAIEVQRGDTVYGIARRHGVAISEVMAVNNLTNPTIHPGQKLYLPAGARSLAGSSPARHEPAPAASVSRVSVSRTPVSTATDRPRQSAGARPELAGSYTVKPGDSLYSIARRLNIRAGALQRANGITDVRRIRPGTVLKVPGRNPGTQTAARILRPVAGARVRNAPPAATSPDIRPGLTSVGGPAGTMAAAAPVAGSPGVRIINGTSPQTPRAAVPAFKAPPRAEPAGYARPSPPNATRTAMKLRWPVKGRVVEGFGRRKDGSHNDGINVAVPLGTDVLAAEDGVVAYAGSEVKTYGNLVLIRHANGWVTAYAYNDKLLVKRGDKVKRGQSVAKAGKTGAVDQPQVHFEVRVGAKPVDPLVHMEKL